MNFANIPAGVSVFIDANTFVYYFAPEPSRQPACQELLERIARAELGGFTSTHVLSEMAHRLMTIEAMKQHGWPLAGIAPRFRKHPAEVCKLTGFRKALQEVPLFGIQVLTISPSDLNTAAAVSQQTGLLCNDALIVTLMRAHGITVLAGSDPDFDRVPGLTRYAPI